ncbi:MAG: hypothetical protein ACK559_31975, partial [bacterium]
VEHVGCGIDGIEGRPTAALCDRGDRQGRTDAPVHKGIARECDRGRTGASRHRQADIRDGARGSGDSIVGERVARQGHIRRRSRVVVRGADQRQAIIAIRSERVVGDRG